MRDLLILCPDTSIKAAVNSLLTRRKKALNISEIAFDIKVHSNRDPGILGEGLEFLRANKNQYHKFLLILDREGCGSNESPEEIRNRLMQQAPGFGFKNNELEIIVINPELEIWVWKNKLHLARMVDWTESQLSDWLKVKHKIEKGKPDDPKSVYEDLLRHRQKAKSSANFGYLAEKISLRNCQEPGFQLLSETLKKWFPGKN